MDACIVARVRHNLDSLHPFVGLWQHIQDLNDLYSHLKRCWRQWPCPVLNIITAYVVILKIWLSSPLFSYMKRISIKKALPRLLRMASYQPQHGQKQHKTIGRINNRKNATKDIETHPSVLRYEKWRSRFVQNGCGITLVLIIMLDINWFHLFKYYQSSAHHSSSQ